MVNNANIKVGDKATKRDSESLVVLPFFYEDRQGSFGILPELPWQSRHF